MDLEHEKRLTSVEARSKSNSHRIDEVEKRQDKLDELVGAVSLIASREERVEADVKEIKADVKEITGKPARMWEAIVEKVVVAIAAAVVGFFLAKIGL
jgi:predicted  nucleic acid-binding Zn-ribbon protein